MHLTNIITAIEAGKTRGYQVMRLEAGNEFWYEYAIRKKQQVYLGYYFKVPTAHMEQFEDYAIEECEQFATLEDAMDFITTRNGKLELFQPFKGTSPI